MAVIFKIKQTVSSVNKKWLETIYEGPVERVMKYEFDRLAKENPCIYFELVREEYSETCLAWTSRTPPTPKNYGGLLCLTSEEKERDRADRG